MFESFRKEDPKPEPRISAIEAGLGWGELEKTIRKNYPRVYVESDGLSHLVMFEGNELFRVNINRENIGSELNVLSTSPGLEDGDYSFEQINDPNSSFGSHIRQLLNKTKVE